MEQRMGSSETTRQIPHLTKELAILLALLYTDGCVSPKGKHSWRIYFACTSEYLITLFRKCMLSSFELATSRVRIGYTVDGLTKAVVDSKEIGHELVSTF